MKLAMCEAALGPAFARLAPALQRFHRLSGAHVLSGEVHTEGPVGPLARLLGRLLGTPRQASAGPIRFELFATPLQERWVRHFPQQRMSSVLSLQQGRIVERLGAARLEFALSEQHGGLQMQLCRLHFLGLPCPRWLCPRIVAEERGDGDRLLFDISATVPGIGRVVGYRGHLDLGSLAIRTA